MDLILNKYSVSYQPIYERKYPFSIFNIYIRLKTCPGREGDIDRATTIVHSQPSKATRSQGFDVAKKLKEGVTLRISCDQWLCPLQEYLQLSIIVQVFINASKAFNLKW